MSGLYTYFVIPCILWHFWSLQSVAGSKELSQSAQNFIFLLWWNAIETHAGNVANWYHSFSFSKWKDYSSCKWSHVFEKEGWGQYSAHLRVSFSAKRRWKIYITPFCFTNKFSSLIQLSSKVKNMDRISYNHWKKKKNNITFCIGERHSIIITNAKTTDVLSLSVGKTSFTSCVLSHDRVNWDWLCLKSVLFVENFVPVTTWRGHETCRNGQPILQISHKTQ